MNSVLKRALAFDVNYLELRPGNLTSPRFRHLFLLLYWPLFGMLFAFVERFSPVTYYFPVHIALDDLIPFCEWFVLPYYYWFIYLIGMICYTLLYDVREFRRMSWFVIVTYSITMLIYFIWPTCQELRPAVFPRDNALTRWTAMLYDFDTNTNVCPSIHVIGSVAAMLAGLHGRRFRTWGWRVYFIVGCALISISTVFMKQHSALDIFAAIPVCLIGYLAVYVIPGRKKKP